MANQLQILLSKELEVEDLAIINSGDKLCVAVIAVIVVYLYRCKNLFLLGIMISEG